MEEGSLRCDANISTRLRDGAPGTKIEIKNMNSFKSVKDAMEYEEKRQREKLAAGETIVQETRGWDEKKGITISMRSKEEEHDYRYFPEPDLLPLKIEKQWIEEIRQAIPELPDQRKERFMQQYALSCYDAEFLTTSREMADFFENTCSIVNSPKTTGNWLMGDISRYLNKHSISISDAPITPLHLARMIQLLENNTISGKIAKSLLEEMLATGREPEELIEAHGWFQISDEGELRAIVKKVIEDSPGAAEDYRSGKKKSIGFLVGQVMKATRGKANPGLINTLIIQEIGKGSGE
jgi:aspartyl-tRNA(Asn)/glutamyl-tRNA(Gln) amidotransferase subunit B